MFKVGRGVGGEASIIGIKNYMKNMVVRILSHLKTSVERLKHEEIKLMNETNVIVIYNESDGWTSHAAIKQFIIWKLMKQDVIPKLF